MRRKIATTSSAVLLMFFSWAIPQYLEVKEVITQENSYWLLYSIYIGVFIVVIILVWGYWPMVKRIRFHKPITFQQPESPKSADEKPMKAELYLNRKEMTKARGTLADELYEYERVWGVFYTGAVLASSGLIARCHFEKLILIDPNSSYMMSRLEPRGSQSRVMYSEQIRQTAEIASRSGARVAYYDGPIGNGLIIADKVKLAGGKFSEQAWAKVETAIPFLVANDRMSIIIRNKDNPDSFNALVKHFETIWGRSKIQTTKTLRLGYST